MGAGTFRRGAESGVFGREISVGVFLVRTGVGARVSLPLIGGGDSAGRVVVWSGR